MDTNHRTVAVGYSPELGVSTVEIENEQEELNNQIMKNEDDNKENNKDDEKLEVKNYFEEVILDQSDINSYKENKNELKETLRKYGSAYFFESSLTGMNGLLNQGATCYLNSLLQTLYHTKRFRNAIYNWRLPDVWREKLNELNMDNQGYMDVLDSNDEERMKRGYTVNDDFSSILSLKGYLERSIPFQLQSLFSRLKYSSLAAISTKALTKSFGWSALESFQQHDAQELCRILFTALETSRNIKETIIDLYEGIMLDTLKCTECNYVKQRENIYNDIQLPIKDLNDLGNAFQSYITPEYLDKDNGWHCPKCDEKVRTAKSLQFKTFPKIMVLHLMRFVFDYMAMKRVKLNDSFYFPETIDMAPYYAELSNEEDNSSDQHNTIYHLYAILIHSGTAHGGHYYAYIKSGGKWYNFNDAHVSELEEDEVKVLFDPDFNYDKTDELNDKGTDNNEDNDEKGNENEDKIDNDNENENDNKNENKNKEKEKVPRKIVTTSEFASRNAYLLMYKLEDTSDNNDDDANDIENSELPKFLIDQIIEENEKYTILKKAYQAYTQMTNIEIYTGIDDLFITLDEHKSFTLQDILIKSIPFLKEKAETVVNELLIEKTREYEEEKHEDDIVRYEQKLEQNINEIQNFIETINNTPIECCRLRKYHPYSRRRGETFGKREHSTLEVLKIFPASQLILETKNNDEEWVEFNPNEMFLNVILWDRNTHATSISKDFQWNIIVPGESKATVGGLREKVLEKLSLININNPEYVLLLKLDNDRIALLKDDDRYLRQHYKVWSGEDIIVEVINKDMIEELKEIEKKSDENEISKTNHEHLDYSYLHSISDAIQVYHQAKNMIKVLFNPIIEGLNEDENENTVELEANLEETLGDLKQRICEFINLPMDDVILKRSRAGVQLKDLKLTLRSLSFCDQTFLYIKRGKPCNINEYLIKFYIFEQNETNQKWEPNFFMELPISSISKVRDIKEIIYQELVKIDNIEMNKYKSIENKSFLRLREKKRQNMGSVFRDERSLKRSVIGLNDGHEIGIQILNHSESIGKNDIMIQIRIWKVRLKKLLPAEECFISKELTTQELFNQLLEKYSNDIGNIEIESTEENNTLENRLIMGMAKAPTHGPPLNMKKVFRLKWNDPNWDPSDTITKHPLSIRDGSLIILRSQYDFEEARREARARKAMKEKENGGKSTEKRTAKSASRFRKNGLSKSNWRGPERSLKIQVMVGDDQQPMESEAKVEINEESNKNTNKNEASEVNSDNSEVQQVIEEI